MILPEDGTQGKEVALQQKNSVLPSGEKRGRDVDNGRAQIPRAQGRTIMRLVPLVLVICALFKPVMPQPVSLFQASPPRPCALLRSRERVLCRFRAWFHRLCSNFPISR